MTIFQIECFLAVAEHLNFARAATQLNVSQPAITRQIHTLEAELGTQLFIRSTRKVRLTENGRIFQSDAQLIVNTSRRSVQRFASQDESKIIDFHIGCANPLHMELLSNALGRFLVFCIFQLPVVDGWGDHARIIKNDGIIVQVICGDLMLLV